MVKNGLSYIQLRESNGNYPVFSEKVYVPDDNEWRLYEDMLREGKWVHRGLTADGCDEYGPFQRETVYVVDESCSEDMLRYKHEKEDREWELEPSQQVIYPRLRIVDEVEESEVKRRRVDTPNCPLHVTREMAIKEITTVKGPSQLHFCPVRGCVISCFGTNEDRDKFLDTVAHSLHHVYRNKQCPLVCFCGDKLLLKMSKSEANPDRLFLSCRSKACKMFQWGDDWPHKKVYQHWYPPVAVTS